MTLQSALAITLVCSVPLVASPQRTAPSAQSKTPSLAERFPVPDGYSAEQDTESDGTQNFSTANDVRGHILRRFVQAGDDGPKPVAEIVRFFAGRLRAQNGFLFDDRFSSGGGRLDGRIPGPKPVWLHVDISDEGRGLDIIALEETTASTRPMPVEETSIPGSWSTGETFVDMPSADRAGALRARDAIAALASPSFRPYQGWAWRVTVDDFQDNSAGSATTFPYQVGVFGFPRSQPCATCPVTTDTHGVTAFTVDVNRVESIGEPDQATLKAEGFFIDPGFTTTGQITPFKDGGRILITRVGRPALFVPVTRDAYLQARIRYTQTMGGAVGSALDAAVVEFEKAMKELEKTNPAAAKQARAEFAESRKANTGSTGAGVDALKQELAALSVEEKRAPAEDLVGRKVVRLNPAYFESGRPRTAPHFAVVDVPWKYGVHEVTLYQRDLVEKFLTSVPLAELVK